MLVTSGSFAALMDVNPYTMHLTLSDGSEVPREAIRTAKWSGGSNAGDDITFGSTVAGHMEMELDRTKLGSIDLTDAMLAVTLTLEGAEDELPVAVLQVTDIDGDDDTLTISAGDAMLFAFSAQYDLDDAALGFDWNSGVDGMTLLDAICGRCGVTLRTTDLPAITLSLVNAEGYTYREVIAFLACMWGCFARIDGEGQLVLRWYSAVERPVTSGRYYDGELKKADYNYTVGYVRCYVEPLEETLFVGNTVLAQGIYIQCPWMTQERLEAIWEAMGGFLYRPVSGLKFLGDPRLEPGDIIKVTSRSGVTYTVPCMTVQHEYDGGIITTVTAVGKSVSKSEQDYEGPITRAIQRAEQNIKASIIKYQDSIEAKVEATDGRVSKISQKVDSITLSVSDPTADGYVSLSLIVGGVTQSLGLIKMDGNVDISGSLSASALYAALGEIAQLTVDSLSTARKIPRYLAQDTSDINYIEIKDRRLALCRAWTDGSTVQATNPNGQALYWETDISGATIGDDGYPYISGTRVFATPNVTDYPTMIYRYEEGDRWLQTFDAGNNYGPIQYWGEGYGDAADPDRGKGIVRKLGASMEVLLKTSEGRYNGVVIGDKYTDIYGVRKPTKISVDDYRIQIDLQGDAHKSYDFDYDESGNLIGMIDGDDHYIELEFGGLTNGT